MQVIVIYHINFYRKTFEQMCFFNLNPRISRTCYGWKLKSTTKLIQTLWIQLGNDSFIIVHVGRSQVKVFVLFSSKGKHNSVFNRFSFFMLMHQRNARHYINLIRSFHFMKSLSTITFYFGVGLTLTLAIVWDDSIFPAFIASTNAILLV